MTFALKAFRDIQISNPEDTVGSAEAATAIMLGTITPTYSGLEIHYPEQERALLARNMADDFIVSKMVELTFEAEMNMNDIIWMFSNAIRGNITPTQPDATNQPNAYLWAFAPNNAAANTPDIANGIDTFTLEWGDNVQHYETSFLFTRVLTISGAPNEPVQVSWEITGAQVTESAKTAALSVVATQYFPFNLTKFYVDTSYAGIGGTQKTNMLRAFEWTLETQFTPRFAADGGYIYTGLNEDRKKVDLELTYYRDSTNTAAARDLFDARSTTYLRIECLDATELDSGQSNPPYVRLDGAFRYTDWPEASDEEGSVVETVPLESVYDTTGTQQFETSVLTSLSAYP
jgi:hypothetical protein